MTLLLVETAGVCDHCNEAEKQRKTEGLQQAEMRAWRAAQRKSAAKEADGNNGENNNESGEEGAEMCKAANGGKSRKRKMVKHSGGVQPAIRTTREHHRAVTSSARDRSDVQQGSQKEAYPGLQWRSDRETRLVLKQAKCGHGVHLLAHRYPINIDKKLAEAHELPSTPSG